MKKLLQTFRKNGRQNNVILAAVLLFLTFGMTSIGYGLATQVHLVQPEYADKAARGELSSNREQSDTSSKNHSGKTLPFSRPLRIDIPGIQTESDLIEVGQNSDGTIEVPAGENYNKAAWYKYGATPGQLGSAVIEGHVDSADGKPSVFFNLGKLKPGDTVTVTREDGIEATFAVDSVRLFSKDDFPTLDVYGPKNHAGLSLITCGGEFDKNSGEYRGNLIVSTHMISSRNLSE